MIARKYLVSKLRKVVHSIPILWKFYGAYWRIRIWFEARKKYSTVKKLYDFGKFSISSLDNPTSQLCTSNQLLSPIYRKWCDEMGTPVRFARKQWEFVYILQALSLAGMLNSGKKGLGFGCGREPLSGLFAKYGCNILATDLEQSEALEQGWVDNMQHISDLDSLYSCASDFISHENFMKKVNYRSLDMNDVPADLYNKFDFIWSACAFEHLGSLQHGIDFVKNSARCLKKGGVAVHTTEFNLSSNDDTCEQPSCSVYRARDIERLISELEVGGYIIETLNLNTGEGNVDNYIDIPPYKSSPHLKLELSGYTVTSIGLIVRCPT